MPKLRVSLVDTTAEGRFSLAELKEGWAPYGSELLLHDPDGPRECLVRRGELIAEADSLAPVLDRLGRWVDGVHHDDDLLLARLRLRASERDRCVDIVRDSGPDEAAIAANHVHVGSPVMFGNPVLFGTGANTHAGSWLPSPPEHRWDPPVPVGVLDTGLDPHPWFTGRRWFEAVPEVLDADDDSGQDRQAGHGTFVSGVVLQHAPGAVIRPRRVLSSLGYTDDLTLVAGLRQLRRSAAARGEGAGVVLLTTGCHTADDSCPPVLRAEIDRNENSIIVAAAGNQSTSRPFWPAALPGVVGVAATGSGCAVAEFSNFGPWVDAAAAGVNVPSSYVLLDSAAGRSYGFAHWSGTSFAAPVVAAEAAIALRDGHEPVAAANIATQRYPFGR